MVTDVRWPPPTEEESIEVKLLVGSIDFGRPRAFGSTIPCKAISARSLSRSRMSSSSSSVSNFRGVSVFLRMRGLNPPFAGFVEVVVGALGLGVLGRAEANADANAEETESQPKERDLRPLSFDFEMFPEAETGGVARVWEAEEEEEGAVGVNGVAEEGLAVVGKSFEVRERKKFAVVERGRREGRVAEIVPSEDWERGDDPSLLVARSVWGKWDRDAFGVGAGTNPR